MELCKTKSKIPEISIIVPFYNSERYICRCLNSIIKFTKASYELICVNDGSTDKSVELVKSYCQKHKNIKYLSFEKNSGLYLARLAGVKAAAGKYIGFVDSDDFVSKHYFDRLLKAAKRRKADISVAKTVNVAPDGYKYIQTRCEKFPYQCTKQDVREKGLYSLYWQQSGRCYHWHVVWNKLYKRQLWDEAVPVLEKQVKHLVMLEDFIFSSIVLSAAKIYARADSSRYYYISHSHNLDNINNLAAVEKNITDMDSSFDFIQKWLTENEKHSCYLYCLEQWRQRYGRYWKRNIEKSSLSDTEKIHCIHMLEKMTTADIGEVTYDDEYYYEIMRSVKNKK